MPLNAHTHTHSLIYNAWPKLEMCFYVVHFEGKIHLLLSHFPVFPQPVCEPISCLQPAPPVIPTVTQRSDWMHTLTAHTHTHTMKLITACSGKKREWFRHVGAEAQKIFLLFIYSGVRLQETQRHAVISPAYCTVSCQDFPLSLFTFCEEVCCQRP